MSDSELPESAIVIPDMCNLHQSTIVHGLRLRQRDPWKVAIVIANMMLFQAASAGDVIWKRAANADGSEPSPKDVSLVLAEIGCLGCLDNRNFQRVFTILRKYGLSDAAKISRGELDSPFWPYFKKQGDG
jgi:hypothetical protein